MPYLDFLESNGLLHHDAEAIDHIERSPIKGFVYGNNAPHPEGKGCNWLAILRASMQYDFAHLCTMPSLINRKFYPTS